MRMRKRPYFVFNKKKINFFQFRLKLMRINLVGLKVGLKIALTFIQKRGAVIL